MTVQKPASSVDHIDQLEAIGKTSDALLPALRL
jgi:hypothetical protein